MEEEEDRRDLVGKLFALLTAKLEDGAAAAAEGQRRSIDKDALCKLGEGIRTDAEEVAVIAAAAVAIAASF